MTGASSSSCGGWVDLENGGREEGSAFLSNVYAFSNGTICCWGSMLFFCIRKTFLFKSCSNAFQMSLKYACR